MSYPESRMARKTTDTAVADFAQAIGMLVRRVRAASASQELSWTEAAVLGRLARGGAATTADLARAEGMKPQSMRTTIAALEERCLIERKAHPTDGREVLIQLTAKGSEVRDRVKTAKRTWLAQAIARLSEREKEIVFEAGEIFRRLAEEANREDERLR